MSKSSFSAAVLIDYDNLLPEHKMAGILDVVTRALVQIDFDDSINRCQCDVRVYGGWYEGTQISRLAQDLTVEIHGDFPKVLHLPTRSGGRVSVVAHAQLAVALLQEPGHHLFNTYRRKGKPANVRVEQPNAIGCTDPTCLLPLVKKLLKTGNCPKAGCTVGVGSLVYRHEQKIVDTMLSCDLIHVGRGNADWIILISGDDDFLPPLRTVLLNGGAVIRFHPRPSFQRASFTMAGAQLIEKGL